MKRFLRPALPVLSAAICLAVFSGRTSAVTITVPIAAPFDDMEENLDDGTQDTGSSDIELNTEGPPEPRQIVGLRFVDLGIPAFSTINSASIQFMVDEDDNEVTNVRIYGDQSANSAPFVDELNHLSTRSQSRTSNSVVWSNIPVWAGEGTTGPDQRTPDLSPIVQEIVDLPGWSAGNAMSFLIFSEPESDNTGERTAISFEKARDNPGAGFSPAILTVDYTAIPEPSTWALAAVAIAAAAFVRQRRR